MNLTKSLCLEFCKELEIVNCTADICSQFVVTDNTELDKTAFKHNGTFTVITHSDWKKYESIVIIIVSALSLLANFNVISMETRNKSNMKFFVSLLAISDSTFAFFRLLVVTPSLVSHEWGYHPISCKLFVTVTEGGSFISISLVFLISLQRCRVVVHETRTGHSKTFCIGYGFLILILAVGSLVPMIQVLDVDQFGICREIWPGDWSMYYSWYLLIVVCMLPSLGLTYLNIRIALFLQRNMTNDTILQLLSARECSKRRKDKRKAQLHLLLLMVCFICCVSPTKIFWVLQDTVGIENQNVYLVLSFISSISYAFHTLSNPIMYTISKIPLKSFLKQNLIIKLFISRKSDNQTSSKILSSKNNLSSLKSTSLLKKRRSNKHSIV
eukprot:TCONS_00004579-protein